MRFMTAALIVFATAGAAHAEMSASVDWGQTKKCFDSKSPPITLSSVPEGTVKLDIKMQDRDARDFYHGGGRVDYTGQAALPYGAFRYKGPCPPSGSHLYRFTVKALDAKGKTIGTAQAEKKFP